jgi:hypothetical protein
LKPPGHRPVTRSYDIISALFKVRPDKHFINGQFFRRASPEDLKDLARYGKSGGPDIRNLIGVCICVIPNVFLAFELTILSMQHVAY